MSVDAKIQAGDVRSLVHDLKTPLTSLKSCLDLILAGDAGPVTGDQDRFLKVALRNLTHLDELVEALGEGCRTSGGKAHHARGIDLGPILAEAVSRHAAAAERAGQEIDASGLPGSFITCAEPTGVVRMLDNVLGNAVRHAGPGAVIRVWLDPRPKPEQGLALGLARHCYLPDNFFSLVVEDSGPGLPTEVGRWVDGDPGEACPSGGQGLGITAALARARGGALKMVSAAGRGTTAWIHLPMDPDTAHLQRAVGELEGAGARSGGRLHLLDLRDGPGEAALHASRVDEFLGRETGACPGGGVELAHGLWAAVLDDSAGWNGRWASFASRKGRGLEATRWRPFGEGTEGNDGESQEMFNPVEKEPIKSP